MKTAIEVEDEWREVNFTIAHFDVAVFVGFESSSFIFSSCRIVGILAEVGWSKGVNTTNIDNKFNGTKIERSIRPLVRVRIFVGSGFKGGWNVV